MLKWWRLRRPYHPNVSLRATWRMAQQDATRAGVRRAIHAWVRTTAATDQTQTFDLGQCTLFDGTVVDVEAVVMIRNPLDMDRTL